MDLEMSEAVLEYRFRLEQFMDEHIDPNERA